MIIRLYFISFILSIMLFCMPLYAQQKRVDNSSKVEIQRLDNLYTVFTKANRKEIRQKGQQVVEELIKQGFVIDSLLLSNTLSESDFKRFLTKEVVVYLLRNEQFRKCYKVAESLVKQSKDASDTTRMIVGYYFMGFSSQKMGEIDNGLKYGLVCYDLCKVVKDEEMLSSTLNNLGNIYMTNNQDSIAAVYFSKSLAIERKLKRKAQQAIRLGNISSAYVKMGKLPEALDAAEEGLKLSRETGRIDRIAMRLQQLSEVYMAMKAYKKALECSTESVAYFKKAESAYGQAIVLNFIGDIMQKLGNEAMSENYFEQALHFAQKEQNNLLMQQIFKNLYKVNKIKNPTKALNFFERHIELKDTVFHAENQKQLNDFHVKYEIQEKEYELALHKQKLKLARLQQLFLAIILLLLAIIIISLIVNRISNRKQNKKLKEMNATKDKLFSIISHDLKSPAIAQKVAIEAMMQHVSKYDEETLSLLKAFSNTSESQLALLQDLLNWANMQTGKMVFNPIVFNLSGTIAKTKELYAFSASNKNLQFALDVSEKCMVYADRQMISTVMRNLFNNAVKFSNPNGVIKVSVSCLSLHTRVSITNSSIGMLQQQIDNLLFNGVNKSKDGTNGEKGSGLGLIICKDLLEQNGSHLEIESKENKETTFSFNLPNA